MDKGEQITETLTQPQYGPVSLYFSTYNSRLPRTMDKGEQITETPTQPQYGPVSL